MAKEFTPDPKKASEQEIAEGLALLGKKREHDHKVKTGQIKGSKGKKWSELSQKEKDQRRSYSRKREIKLSLLAKKAEAAGIKVSDAEVEAEIRKRG